MAELVLREGLDQPRPLVQIEALLSDARLQQSLPASGTVALHCGTWLIGTQELEAMRQALADAGLALTVLRSAEPRTRVAAAALGIPWHGQAGAESHDEPASPSEAAAAGLRIHQGTLRAGDQLDTDGSLLVLGDVNPGARISAGGHVMVWGTLRGVAHAGSRGDSSARITALQLRPLQLRIAAAVARGPDEVPLGGLAEQAELIDGVIAIKPASPQWPLSG